MNNRTLSILITANALSASLFAAQIDVLKSGVTLKDGVLNDPQVQAIVDAAKPGDEIFFPKGIYRFDKAVVMVNRKDLTFTGEPGTVFNLTFVPGIPAGKNAEGFVMTRCSNIKFEKFTFTTTQPSSCAGHVVAKNPEALTYDVKIEDEFNFKGTEPLAGTDTCDDEGTPDYVIETGHSDYKVLGPNLIRVNAPKWTNFNRMKIGHRVLYRYIIYGRTVFSFTGCWNVTLKDIEIERCASMGAVIAPPSGNFTFDHFNMRVPKDSKALYCANADGIHILGLAGYLHMYNCEFLGLGDDALNIHAKAGEVKEWDPESGNILCICRNTKREETRLPSKWAVPGDYINIYDAKTLLTKGLVKFDRYTDDGKGHVIAGDVKINKGDYLSNDKDFASVHIAGCSVKNTRARGFLLQSKNMVVENCRFYGLSLPGVIISPDFRFWNEVGPTVNTEIKNCVFEKCCINGSRANLGALMVKTSHDAVFNDEHPAGVHQDIRIIGNDFINCGNSGVFLQSTKGVVVRGNTFERCSTHRYDEKDDFNLFDIRLRNCSEVTIEDNHTDKPAERLQSVTSREQ